MKESPKFPDMKHLPWSEEAEETRTNKVLDTVDGMGFTEGDVVITEKMDGGNSCITSEKVFARSHSGEPHREEWDYLKKMHRENLMHKIPENIAVYGEYLYARHSIKYTNLPEYFIVFGVLDMEQEEWLSWRETEGIAMVLDLPTAPVIKKGEWNEIDAEIHPEGESEYGDTREGYVIRKKGRIPYGEWVNNAAKCVRKDHIRTEELHWRKGGETETNDLAGEIE